MTALCGGQRDIGGGRKAKLLSPQEKLFFILFYFKCYPTFDLAGILFDLDRSQTNRWMHRLQPILEEVLNQKMVLPLRRIRDVEEFTEHFPEVQAPHGGQPGHPRAPGVSPGVLSSRMHDGALWRSERKIVADAIIKEWLNGNMAKTLVTLPISSR